MENYGKSIKELKSLAIKNLKAFSDLKIKQQEECTNTYMEKKMLRLRELIASIQFIDMLKKHISMDMDIFTYNELCIIANKEIIERIIESASKLVAVETRECHGFEFIYTEIKEVAATAYSNLDYRIRRKSIFNPNVLVVEPKDKPLNIIEFKRFLGENGFKYIVGPTFEFRLI